MAGKEPPAPRPPIDSREMHPGNLWKSVKSAPPGRQAGFHASEVRQQPLAPTPECRGRSKIWRAISPHKPCANTCLTGEADQHIHDGSLGRFKWHSTSGSVGGRSLLNQGDQIANGGDTLTVVHVQLDVEFILDPGDQRHLRQRVQLQALHNGEVGLKASSCSGVKTRRSVTMARRRSKICSGA